MLSTIKHRLPISSSVDMASSWFQDGLMQPYSSLGGISRADTAFPLESSPTGASGVGCDGSGLALPVNYSDQSPSDASSMLLYYTMNNDTQPLANAGQPGSTGVAGDSTMIGHFNNQCSDTMMPQQRHQPDLLAQPSQMYRLAQPSSSMPSAGPTSAAMPIKPTTIADIQHDTNLLLQLQMLQLEQEQQQQQAQLQHLLELEQLSLLVQQQHCHQPNQEQQLVIGDPAGELATQGDLGIQLQSAAQSEGAAFYQGTSFELSMTGDANHASREASHLPYTAAAAPVAAASDAYMPSQMYLLKPPSRAPSQRRYSMLQLPTNSLLAVQEEAAGGHRAPGSALKGPSQRRYSMVQLQGHALRSAGLEDEAASSSSAAAAAAVASRGGHRAPGRAASFGAQVPRTATVAPAGTVLSPTSCSMWPGAEEQLESPFHQYRQLPVPAAQPAAGDEPGWSRGTLQQQQCSGATAAASLHQLSWGQSLASIPGEGPAAAAGRVRDHHHHHHHHQQLQPHHRRQPPHRAASWAPDTFRQRRPSHRASVDLSGGSEAVAAAAAAGGGMGPHVVGAAGGPPAAGAHQGQRRNSNLELSCTPQGPKGRRNSIEAPKWAGAFWNPMAEVVKSGQLANGGTGVFIPKNMQIPLAAEEGKGAKGTALQGEKAEA